MGQIKWKKKNDLVIVKLKRKIIIISSAARFSDFCNIHFCILNISPEGALVEPVDEFSSSRDAQTFNNFRRKTEDDKEQTLQNSTLSCDLDSP